jgi:hypothetical protein
MHGRDEDAHKILVGRRAMKRSIEKLTLRWEIILILMLKE